MKYKVAIKLSTTIFRTVEAASEEDIYSAIDDARAGWDMNDVLVSMDEIEQVFIYDKNGNIRKVEI